MKTGDGRDVQYSATFRVQVRTAWPSGGQGQGAADDLLLGGKRAPTQPGAAADHGNAAGSGGRRHGRVLGGQTGAVASCRSQRVGNRFRLMNNDNDFNYYYFIFHYNITMTRTT